ncbi:MAG: hypothetical protein C0601_04110 [Candidatus Muiribacterium halophilum]|uniref:Uncharacterized protein n=1 Tax=Muiribacterium halophilum TaxID=2053465 RepID=A0A2N5ZJA3_MUIH1|nr:MAG: hypothetical protein C0601_04110 [Candidatus Muirbacterium halophilum]
MYMDCECFKLFLSKVMNMKKRDFDITWKKSIFTGRGKPPKIFRSLPEIVNYVKMNRNALAIVNPESITEDVKVLRIIEHVSSSN